MEAVLTLATILVPFITALTQLAKNTVSIPKNYIPLVALIIGLLIGFAAAPFTDLNVVLRLWAGGIAGLSSTGLYEAVKQRSGQSKE